MHYHKDDGSKAYLKGNEIGLESALLEGKEIRLESTLFGG
jgi:hypothetical protein